MDQVILVLDVSLIEYLTRKAVRIEEFCLLLLLSKGRNDLLEAYLRRNITAEQRSAVFQSLVRKLLVVQKESNSFSVEDYEITEAGRLILADTGSATNVIELVTGLPLNIPTADRTEFDTFVDQYLELFPKGVKNGGNKPLRSNATDVKAKMIKFMNKYKHTKETILKATGNYLDRMRGVYTYCPTSEYFIMKDGSSALATECDGVKNGSNNEELIDPFQKHM